MKKLTLFFLLFVLLTACYEKQRTLYVFIPEGYLGDVGLYFNSNSSGHHMIASKDDTYFIFLTGKDLRKFKIEDNNFPGGPYQINYFYYSKDTLYQLNSPISGYDIETPVKVGLMSASGENGSIQHFTVSKR